MIIQGRSRPGDGRASSARILESCPLPRRESKYFSQSLSVTHGRKPPKPHFHKPITLDSEYAMKTKETDVDSQLNLTPTFIKHNNDRRQLPQFFFEDVYSPDVGVYFAWVPVKNFPSCGVFNQHKNRSNQYEQPMLGARLIFNERYLSKQIQH